MHLLHHARSRMTSIWVLGGHHMMARGQAVLRHALMSGERLRHHHCDRSPRGRDASLASDSDSDREATEELRDPRVARLTKDCRPILAFRSGGPGDFGSNKRERRKHRSGPLPPSHFIHYGLDSRLVVLQCEADFSEELKRHRRRRLLGGCAGGRRDGGRVRGNKEEGLGDQVGRENTINSVP